jgi:molybdate transport system substrate-binding protein
MSIVRILSGGAAHGLVKALTPAFEAATSHTVSGDFGAVGGMRQRLMDGERPDIVILTTAILRELGEKQIVDAASIRDIGTVPTSIAIQSGQVLPDVSSTAAFRQALLAADAIYFPDPLLATAGIHFHNVLKVLGILDEVQARLRTYPNGATAMRALAEAKDRQPIGCTQATEIVATEGVTLVAALPEPHHLNTVYTAGVVTKSPHAAAARVLISLLCGVENAALRQSCAFV